MSMCSSTAAQPYYYRFVCTTLGHRLFSLSIWLESWRRAFLSFSLIIPWRFWLIDGYSNLARFVLLNKKNSRNIVVQSTVLAKYLPSEWASVWMTIIIHSLVEWKRAQDPSKSGNDHSCVHIYSRVFGPIKYAWYFARFVKLFLRCQYNDFPNH